MSVGALEQALTRTWQTPFQTTRYRHLAKVSALWTGVSIEGFMGRLDNYIHWYNEERIKMSLGERSPMEYRQALEVQENICTLTPKCVTQ